MVSPVAEALQVHGLTKSYGAVRVLSGVDLEVRSGEVVALLGENGAGKSTLVKALAGLVVPESGTIRVDGHEQRIASPSDARNAGIAVVLQELSLVPTLSVAENVLLGSGLRGAWTQARLRRRAAPHLDLVGLPEASRHRPVSELSVAERQLVEIARMLARRARVVVFDEPTAALSDAEIDRVLEVVRRLAAEGHGVVYVTHRLREVYEIADRATVLRGGVGLAPVRPADTPMDALVERMLGRAVETLYPERGPRSGPVRLQVRGLLARGLAEPLDLDVRRGEIVALAGQLGSGAQAVVRAVGGVERPQAGAVRLDDTPLRPTSVRAALARGVATCSEDRKDDGLFLRRSVAENLAVPSLARVSPGGWFVPGRARALARHLAERFRVRLDRLDTRVGALSGGNQQKVALGKWMGRDPLVLLLAEPTRGVDVGARAEIYRDLRRLADDGMAIVLVSSELGECLGLADTVVSFYRGRVVRRSAAGDLTEQALLADIVHGSAEVLA